MKTIIVSALTILSVTVFAVELTPEQREQGRINREKFMKATGGFMVDKRNAVGFVALINGQSRVSADFVKARAAKLEKNIWLSVNYSVPGKALTLDGIDKAVKDSKGNVAIVLIDNKEWPALINIPESKCAVVNVAALSKDCKDNVMLESRLSKEIARAFCFALVVPYSTRPGGTMDIITSMSDLDKVLVDGIGLDLMPFIERSAERFGIKRFKRTTYRKACEEGWAPAPANEYQKAIWDKVHAMPTEPIKIKPETTKQK